MRVMVIVKATADSESGRMPDTQCMAEMGRFNEALAKAGILLAADGLHASMRGKRVHFSGKDRSVVDGPFAETKELIAGYWLWQVKSMEEAVEWVKRCPNPMPGDSDIEIRPLLEAEDFSPAFIAELQAQKARLSAELDARQKS
ncbi:YciI family protein [Burkholderia sp. BCC1999]|uniref:YciI family protein n=1 Tax=Burkholderia sp. BCC1999 TaxID=2817448 RepID=UPI002AC34E56|nr:YciI family protein [Burkholderia sp. BCC1999]